MCLSRETENPSMTCLLSSFVGFHWKGKIPMGFAGLHPPDATGAASEDKPRGSAKEAAASAVHQGGLCCPGEGAGALAQAGLLSTVGLGQPVIRICATSKHTARFYS